jgi:hypothetical protein
MEQPIEDADKLYNHHLAIVLNFFASKLRLYYSSSRLTLLLTFLSPIEHNHLRTHVIPLPSRLHFADKTALGLQSAGGYYSNPEKCYWKIFRDFLDSGNPLALDERRYTIAALACLKIMFGQYQAPVLCITWFSRHSRTLREDMEAHYQRNHTDLPVGINWRRNISLYWDLRTHLPHQMRQGRNLLGPEITFDLMNTQTIQYHRSNHLQFLLEKSTYSDNILDFARYRVFRFGYLARQHPTYMKKAIFALAKYIQRVTGETTEVRACESIWGRHKWFTTQ